MIWMQILKSYSYTTKLYSCHYNILNCNIYLISNRAVVKYYMVKQNAMLESITNTSLSLTGPKLRLPISTLVCMYVHTIYVCMYVCMLTLMILVVILP